MDLADPWLERCRRCHNQDLAEVTSGWHNRTHATRRFVVFSPGCRPGSKRQHLLVVRKPNDRHKTPYADVEITQRLRHWKQCKTRKSYGIQHEGQKNQWLSIHEWYTGVFWMLLGDIKYCSYLKTGQSKFQVNYKNKSYLTFHHASVGSCTSLFIERFLKVLAATAFQRWHVGHLRHRRPVEAALCFGSFGRHYQKFRLSKNSRLEDASKCSSDLPPIGYISDSQHVNITRVRIKC